MFVYVIVQLLILQCVFHVINLVIRIRRGNGSRSRFVFFRQNFPNF